MQTNARSTRENTNNVRKFTSKTVIVVITVVVIVILGVIIDTMVGTFFSKVV